MKQRLIYFRDLRRLCSDKIVVDAASSRYLCTVIPKRKHYHTDTRRGRCNGNNCPIWNGLKKPAKTYLGEFVTAKLKGKIDPRQGWVINENPLFIKGQSGEIYECEGTPAIVENPPQKTNDGMDSVMAAKLRTEPLENLDEGRCQRMDHPLEDARSKEVECCDHEWEPCNAVKCENCGIIVED